MKLNLSLMRILAIVIKEIKELMFDPLTATMIFLIPIIQTILFANAINDDPKHLPTVIMNSSDSSITRSIISDLQMSSYFSILPGEHSPQTIEHLFKSGEAQFAIYIPPNFTKELIRGNKPQITVEADASNPAAVGHALSAFNVVLELYFQKITGTLSFLRTPPAPVDVVVHSKYNPNRITQYNIVPGLVSTVLSLTLVLVTALSVVRERESGTLEILLTTPIKPIEIVIGKILPYIVVAYIQSLIILALAYFVFHIPIHGSLTLLLLCCFPFIIANLALGIAFSTVAESQIQAAQASSLYFLPSLLFSGFIFPFNGLPGWGQFIGNLLPSTHFLVIIRGIMLKGSTLYDIYPHLLAILAMIVVLFVVAINRFHKTLD